MRFGSMWRDVTRSLFRSPATQRYPFERQPTPDRLRGQLHWEAADCTGCGLCAKDCPAGAIEMTVIDKKEKRFVFTYHTDRCTFCAQCIYSCRQGCLSLSSTEWELAALDRASFQKMYGDPADIQRCQAGEPTEIP